MVKERILSESLFYTILQVSKVFRSIFRSHKYPQLAPGHFRIMSYLLAFTPNLQELAERAMVTPATMSRTIDALEEHGWVLRTQNKTDRRQVVITLTDKGQALLETFHRDIVDEFFTRLRGLSCEELEQLEAGLNVLGKVFENPQEDLLNIRRK
jgi:DNA-binding MarR family transcriptional regulator